MKYLPQIIVIFFIIFTCACVGNDDAISSDNPFDSIDLRINQNLIGSWKGVHIMQRIDDNGELLRNDTFEVAFVFNDDLTGIYSSSTKDFPLKNWGTYEYEDVTSIVWIYDNPINSTEANEITLFFDIEIDKADKQEWAQYGRVTGGGIPGVHDSVQRIILDKN